MLTVAHTYIFVLLCKLSSSMLCFSSTAKGQGLSQGQTLQAHAQVGNAVLTWDLWRNNEKGQREGKLKGRRRNLNNNYSINLILKTIRMDLQQHSRTKTSEKVYIAVVTSLCRRWRGGASCSEEMRTRATRNEAKLTALAKWNVWKSMSVLLKNNFNGNESLHFSVMLLQSSRRRKRRVCHIPAQ